MKKYMFAIILLSMAFFTACQSKNQPKTPDGSVKSETPPTETVSPVPAKKPLRVAEAVLHAKVAEAENGTLLVIDHTADAGPAALYTVSSEEDLKAGDIIDIYYNGMIQESYPGRLGEVYAIEKTGEEDDLIGLYLNIFKELYEREEALNSEITEIALDLEKVTNLTAMEKEAFQYKIGCEYEKEAFLGNYEELKAKGRLGKEDSYYENGIIVSIEVEEEKKDSFTFSVSKWRSGLGAVGYSGAKAEKRAGKWSYQPGTFWIS